VADALSKFGLSLGVDGRIFDVVPNFISILVLADVTTILSLYGS